MFTYISILGIMHHCHSAVNRLALPGPPTIPSRHPLLSLAVIISDGLMSPSPSTLTSLPSYNGLSKFRVQSLYSDISRQKHSNPTTYNSNITWWRSTLEALVSLGYQPNTTDTLVLHADQSIVEFLRYEGAGKPLCLGTVIVSFLIACSENRRAD